MGRFVNPGNINFLKTIKEEIYVDKTELIAIINKAIGTKRVCFCNSRPRRFGKSTTAEMLTAYYSRGCSSLELFQPYKIAKYPDFLDHLNKYDIICLDIQEMKWLAKGAEYTVEYLQQQVVAELRKLYPQIPLEPTALLSEALSIINEETGACFGIILDEWDCIIRDDQDKPQVIEEYIGFLRSLFKGLSQSKLIAFAYLTGIFPIKKYNTQSALNNFLEYTMINPGPLAEYIGFTEAEVKELCHKYSLDYKQLRRWYDGYYLGGQHIYNPCSVVNAMYEGIYQSYWSQTGTFETIQRLINLDFTGLKEDVSHLLAGGSINVNVRGFANDMSTFINKDDVFTALIHLGYLTYDNINRRAFIPNEEIREEFATAINNSSDWGQVHDLLQRSQQLIKACWASDSSCVAQLIDQFHQEYTSIIKYNDENSLASLLSIAYLGALEYYYRPVREMPAGKGYADLVFFPKREYPEVPAMVVELKWNKSAVSAVEQIKRRNYPAALSDYTGRVLLIGINYDKASKAHECNIELV